MNKRSVSPHHGRVDRDRPAGPVLADQLRVELMDDLAIGESAEDRRRLLRLCIELADVMSDVFVVLVAEEDELRLVRPQDDAACVDSMAGDRDVLEEVAKVVVQAVRARAACFEVSDRLYHLELLLFSGSIPSLSRKGTLTTISIGSGAG